MSAVTERPVIGCEVCKVRAATWRYLSADRDRYYCDVDMAEAEARWGSKGRRSGYWERLEVRD